MELYNYVISVDVFRLIIIHSTCIIIMQNLEKCVVETKRIP